MDQEPLVTYRVKDSPPSLSEEKQVTLARVASETDPSVGLSGIKLTTDEHWLSPYVAVLVKAAARVSGHFALTAGNRSTQPEEHEMLLNLEAALSPFLRDTPKREHLGSRNKSSKGTT